MEKMVQKKRPEKEKAKRTKIPTAKTEWPRLQRWLWVIITLNLMLILFFWARFLLKKIDQSAPVDEEALIVKTTFESPQKGAKVPDFTVKSLIGESVSLTDFKDQDPVILILLSTWHPFCQDALVILDELSLEEFPWIWLPVAIQEKRATVIDFLDKGDYQLDVYLDETGQVGEKFQVTTLPAYYFIDRDGVLVDLYPGPLSGEELVEKGRQL